MYHIYKNGLQAKGGILVLDDLMAEGGNDKEVMDFFYQTFSSPKHYDSLSLSRYVSTW